jgi:ubiquinone/menaquinone biosynthesis C-methylase UbiE
VLGEDSKVSVEAIQRSPVGRRLAKLLAAAMESRLRYRFFSPARILQGVDHLADRTVLEVGCGTGYFTVPAARIIGDRGSLVAIDILSESVELVSRRVEAAGLRNVRVIKADALDTGMDDGSVDVVLLFGMIPAPMVPLSRLLPELHRLLRRDGILAVWPAFPGWLSSSVVGTGLFSFARRRNGVLTFRRAGVAE